ncbi:MAG TPA: hypothetical protein VG868_05075 [Casimicrobiaceae bacterium]|nr:hypothetical protein [Casimicrobiaceae bacterium]
MHPALSAGLVAESKDACRMLNDRLDAPVVALGEVVGVGQERRGLTAFDQIDESRRRERRWRRVIEERREGIDDEPSRPILGEESSNFVEDALCGSGLRDAAHEVRAIAEEHDALGPQRLGKIDLEGGGTREKLAP